MQSTKSFFNGAIFKKTVKRYWPLWVLYTLGCIFVVVIITNNCTSFYNNTFYSQDLLNAAFMIGLFANLVICCVSAMLVHSWMYNARSASAYSALPVKRTSLFCSVTLAGIAPLIGCYLICAVTAILVAAFSGYIIFITALQVFIILSLECILFYGLATLCAALTGHVFVLPAVYLVFNFVAVVVEYLVKEITSLFVYGATRGSIILDFLSPVIYLFDNISANNPPDRFSSIATLENWWPLIIYALVGILFAIIALLVFRRRKMESASDVVAVNFLKPVFKYCLCFGCALVIGTVLFAIIFNSFFNHGDPIASIIISLCMLIGGFIGYFAAEMLMKKSFKVFKKSWKGYLIAGAIMIFFITAMEADLFGYERRIPAIEDVTNVSVDVFGESTAFDATSDIADIIMLQERVINNKAQNEKNIHRFYSDISYRGTGNYYTYNLDICYLLDNGNTMTRSYELMYNESDKLCTDIMDTLSSPTAILNRINSQIDSRYLFNATVYCNYYMAADDYENAKEELMEAVSRNYTSPKSVDVAAIEDTEYVHSDLQLNSIQARNLFENGILKDAANGNIGRIRPRDNKYKDKVNIDIEFSARVPSNDREHHGDYNYQYIYIDDITELSTNTIKVLKTLGLDIEGIASLAIE